MKAFEGNLDVFGSVFNRAVKHHYKFEPKDLHSMMIIADSKNIQTLDQFGSRYCEDRVQFIYNTEFLWSNLIQLIDNTKPDLLLIQRQLGMHAGIEFSLGPLLVNLSQEFEIPILVLPSHQKAYEIKTVLAGFDHKIDNSHLVNHSLMLKMDMENLLLVHIEEESVFNYYMDAITKIPGINTDYAKTNIEKTILDLSGDFFDDVIESLSNKRFKVHQYCRLGDVVKEYQAIVSQHNVDLMVFEAEDDSKLAMHSLGQSLAIQFPHIATLLV